jgi:hypothetical protein
VLLSAACEACDTRRHSDEGSWWRWSRLRLAFSGSNDATLALLGKRVEAEAAALLHLHEAYPRAVHELAFFVPTATLAGLEAARAEAALEWLAATGERLLRLDRDRWLALQASRADRVRAYGEADENETDQAPPQPGKARWRAALEAWGRYFRRLFVQEERRREWLEAERLARDPERLSEILDTYERACATAPADAKLGDFLTREEELALIVAAVLQRRAQQEAAK